MNEYVAPELELVKFLAQDIILTSGEGTEGDGEGNLGENETPPSFVTPV